MMVHKRNLEKNLKWDSGNKTNIVMEQNPSKKTELKSVTGMDVKF